MVEIVKIEWFCDKDTSIMFNHKPIVKVIEIMPEMNTLERNTALLFPFECSNGLIVTVFDRKNFKKYTLNIPKKFRWNGSDIPKLFWNIIGSQHEPQYLVASMLHDFVCSNHYVIDCNRELSTRIFKDCLLEANVPKWKVNLMCFFVDLFQRLFCKW